MLSYKTLLHKRKTTSRKNSEKIQKNQNVNEQIKIGAQKSDASWKQ